MPGPDARKRLILALDVKSIAEAEELADELGDYVGMFKIGLELFCQTGPQIFEVLKRSGHEIFFDSKFLDIPNTVAGASRAAASFGVQIFNVHATGGKEMMKAALFAARSASAGIGDRPKVIAVTILTSIGQEVLAKEVGMSGELSNQVTRLAVQAKECGLDGVVASAHEVKELRKSCGKDFLLITPGIRLAGDDAQDQSRVITPFEAIANGADYLVVGRAITNAANRQDAAKRVLAEIEQALTPV